MSKKPLFFRVFLQVTVTSISPREGKSRLGPTKILGNFAPRLRDPASLSPQMANREKNRFRSDTSSSRCAQLTSGQQLMTVHPEIAHSRHRLKLKLSPAQDEDGVAKLVVELLGIVELIPEVENLEQLQLGNAGEEAANLGR